MNRHAKLDRRPKSKEGPKPIGDASSGFADPGLLEIIGGIAQALGLAEQVQRILPIDRLRSQRRLGRINKLLDQFRKNLDDARAGLRLIRNALAGRTLEIPADAIGIGLPRSELPIYRRGLRQLHDALGKMTDSAYELEAITANVSPEAERFYRISQAGRPVLESLRSALPAGGPDILPHDSHRIDEVLERIDGYLTTCSQRLEDRERWIEQE